MELTLSNPWGLLGLLAVPVVVAIHFLQRRSRSYTVSTLFLVPQNRMEARSGSLFHFWRNSVSFWMQVLAALLLTWLLIQPRWMDTNFRQHVILIYDSSVSMQAFVPEVKEALKAIIRTIGGVGGEETEWILLPSDSRAGLLYRGTDSRALLDEAVSYLPSAGRHSFEDVFRIASELDIEGRQRILLLTDHIPDDLPEICELYAVGKPLPNVGFSGLRVEIREGVPVWRASVRNYGDQAVRLNWRLLSDDRNPVEATLELKARGTKVLVSGFPEETDASIELQLPDDAFAPDNRITIFQPKRKGVRHGVAGSADFLDAFTPFIESITGSSIQISDTPPHFSWIDGSVPVRPSESVPYTVQFVQEPGEGARRMQGFYTAERDALMEGLNWNALVYTPTSKQSKLESNERALLWHDDKPLIFLRERTGGSDLCFTFDPLQSNALRLPGFLILLHRFVALGEATLPLFYRDNFEGNQSLGFESLRLRAEDVIELNDSRESERSRQVEKATVVRAPIVGTTLAATLNGEPLMKAATFFAETAEADFSSAATQNSLAQSQKELIENNSEADFLTPVWLLLLAGALLFNWYFSSKGR